MVRGSSSQTKRVIGKRLPSRADEHPTNPEGKEVRSLNPSMRHKRDLELSKFRQDDSEGSVVKSAAYVLGYVLVISAAVYLILHFCPR